MNVASTTILTDFITNDKFELESYLTYLFLIVSEK